MNLPRIESYYPYNSENYGVNSLKIILPDIIFFFSYHTVIAFIKNNVLTIRKNEWSTTTGKHLNIISDDKKIRIDGEIFEAKLKEVLKQTKIS